MASVNQGTGRKSSPASFTSMTPPEARAAYEKLAAATPRRAEVETVRDIEIPAETGTFRGRLYRPKEAPVPGGAVLFFHGGGWVIGSVDTHDAAVRSLAAASGLTVISADYRLGPESPMPAAADDALAIFRFIQSHASDYGIDPGKLALSGDSAGASLAASTAVASADTPQRPAALLLFYPSLDQRREAESLASRRIFSEGGPVTKSLSDWFASYALKGVRRDVPRVSPMASRSLAGLPPTMIITAEHDIRHDEGRLFAQRLDAARVPVIWCSIQDAAHGFLEKIGSHAAKEALQDAAFFLKQRLSTP